MKRWGPCVHVVVGRSFLETPGQPSCWHSFQKSRGDSVCVLLLLLLRFNSLDNWFVFGFLFKSSLCLTSIDIFLFRCQFQNCHFPSNQFDVVVWPILRWIRFECFNDRQPTKSSIVFFEKMPKSFLFTHRRYNVSPVPTGKISFSYIFVWWWSFFKKMCIASSYKFHTVVVTWIMDASLFSSLTHTRTHTYTHRFFPFPALWLRGRL